MRRTVFFNKTTVDGEEELDFLDHNLSKFELSYPPSYYRVTSDDLLRPDMISYKVYYTVEYWWIICLVNGIFDPFSDLEEGQLLQIPNILDIYEFQKKFRKR